MEKIIKVEKGWTFQLPQDILEALKLEEGDKVTFTPEYINEDLVVVMRKA